MYLKQVCIPIGCVPTACCPYLPAYTAPEEVPARWGGVCGGSAPVEGDLGGCSWEQNSGHTLLKILPCPNFVAGGINTEIFSYLKAVD